MPKNVLLIYMSLYSPRQAPDGSLTRQTNEAAAEDLFRQTRVDRIIALCSETVRSSRRSLIDKTTLDYFREDFLGKQGKSGLLFPVSVPDSMGDADSAAAIREILTLVEPGDTLYIDMTGGLRNTSMLLITIARYLKDIHDVNTEQVFYSELVNNDSSKPPIIKDCTQLYELFDLISGVDSFFSTGSTLKLRMYRLGKNSREFDELLKLMDVFSDDLALCRASAFRKDLKAIRRAVHNRSVNNNTLEDLLFSVMQERFGKELEPILGKEKYALPSLVAWCGKCRLYQQALTLLTEEMPDFVCRRLGFRPTETALGFMRQQQQNQRLVNDSDDWWQEPLFHFHLAHLKQFCGSGTRAKNFIDLRLIPAAEGESAVYRYAEPSEIERYLQSCRDQGFLQFEHTDSAFLAELIQIYQKVIQLRNQINHAGSTVELPGVVPITVPNIRQLLEKACDALQRCLSEPENT